VPISNIGIRVYPKLPPTTEERIAHNRAARRRLSHVSRGVGDYSEARGWSVYWYDRERVFRDAGPRAAARMPIDGTSLYSRILRVTDYASGMTDRHALATYRRLKGIAIPGRIG
jgi:hypothetical protein